MITHPLSDDPRQDAERVRAFFDQWAVYRKVLDFDYLEHRGAYCAVRKILEELNRPFSLLDLGAGDAECSIGAINGLDVLGYEAVDLSAVALELAGKRAAGLRCEKRFTQADFAEFVRGCDRVFDVVLIGLSFHHLPRRDKCALLPDLRRITAPGGRLIIYEPILRDNESRDDVMTRWVEFVDREWTRLTAEELAAVKKHVLENDHPETLGDYDTMLRAAGYHGGAVRFLSVGEFYALIEARA